MSETIKGSQVIDDMLTYYREHPDSYKNLQLGACLLMFTCAPERRHLHKFLLISMRASIGAGPGDMGALAEWSETHTLAQAVAFLRHMYAKEKAREVRTAERLAQIEGART